MAEKYKPGDKVWISTSYNGGYRKATILSKPFRKCKKTYVELLYIDTFPSYVRTIEDVNLLSDVVKRSLKVQNTTIIKKSKETIKMALTKPAIVTAAVLSIVAIGGLFISGNFNSLVTSKADVDQSWAMVETQYQRRFDLIDNLATSVKSAQKQELSVFTEIADARKQYNASSDKAQAASNIETNITSIVPKLQEAYPEIASNKQVQQLMTGLKETENSILTARDGYNTTAKNYNVNIKSFPKNIFAGMFGYKEQSLFKADTGASKAVKVNL